MPAFLLSYQVLFYFLLYISISVSYYCVKGYNDRKITVIFCFFLLLVNVFFQSLTPGYAPDKEIYEAKYIGINNFYSIAHFNLGFGLYYLYLFLDKIGFPHSSLVVFHVLIINIGLFLISLNKRFSNESFLVMLMFSISWFFVDMSVNSIRQGISSVFFIGFILSITSGKRIFTILLCFLSFIFHWSASIPIIMALVIFITQGRIKGNIYIYFFLVTYLCLSMFGELVTIKFLAQSFSSILGSELISLKVESYFNSNESTYNLSLFQRLSLFFEIILYSVFSLIVCYYCQSRRSATHEDFVKSLYWVLILYSTLSLSMAHAYRNFYWAMIVMPVFIVPYLGRLKKRTNVDQGFYFFILSIMFFISMFGLWRSGLIYSLYDLK